LGKLALAIFKESEKERVGDGEAISKVDMEEMGAKM